MDKKSKDGLKIKLSGLLPELNERQRRLVPEFLTSEAELIDITGISAKKRVRKRCLRNSWLLLGDRVTFM